MILVALNLETSGNQSNGAIDNDVQPAKYTLYAMADKTIHSRNEECTVNSKLCYIDRFVGVGWKHVGPMLFLEFPSLGKL